jgi:acid phosphatase type 7
MRLISRVLVLFFASVTVASAQTLGAGDISLHPASSAALAGDWVISADSTAAEGAGAWLPDRGASKIRTPLAAPSSYFEIRFEAQAGIPYRLWVRLRAENNYWGNDSVFVQFSSAVDASDNPIYRIGSTSAAEVNLEDCSGCGLSRWGWQDNGWGRGVLGPAMYFETSGPQVLRVQSREDGAMIDQIILSPSRFIASAPGAVTSDTTVYPASGGGTPAPRLTLVRGPYLQQVSASAALVVWATREAGSADVRFDSGGSTRIATASTRRVSAATSGLGYDYYHHEARLSSLSPATTYAYEAFVDGQAVPDGAGQVRTAPSRGTGTVRFVAFGDSGTGSPEQRQIGQRLAGETFDLALHAGDIAYGNDSGTGDATYRTYQDWFFGIYGSWLNTRPLFPAEGNHDSRPSNDNGRAYLDLFSLPRNGATASAPDHAERYYSFDYGPVHFIALDTEFAFQDSARRAEQIAWLDNDLASTDQPWKVAFYHRSPYSAGGEHGSDTLVRSTFGPLLERHGVQLALTAHEHTYERTIPIRAGSSGTAVTYIVTGGGGGPVYPSGRDWWTAASASRHHYIRAAADACTLTLAAVGLDGTTFDSKTLSRCSTPPTDPPGDAGDIVLYAADASVRVGGWTVVTDATAAGGRRMHHPDGGDSKIRAALENPSDYFEQTFTAEAGVPYRIWIRGKAHSDYWGNDSVFVQFSGSVTEADAQVFRIGTTSGTEINLEDCSGCRLSGWGWQDNGWGVGVLGPLVYFQTSGTQRIRVQTREDGLSIDQIVLSPERYLSTSPGALKNDTTIIRP